MKKIFYLFSLIFLLSGCVESVALLGSSVGGASSGKLLQSSLQSTLSYGIKKQTGKTPFGHVLAYAEKNNPEKKRETCISFIEKTRSEFCTIAKKKISLTNNVIKEKVLLTAKKSTKIKVNPKVSNSAHSLSQLKKTPRELANAFQAKFKKNLGSGR